MGCAKSKIQQQQQMTQTAASASTLDTVSTAATLLQQQRGSTCTTTTKRPATLFTCDEHEQSMFHLPPELAFAATHHCTTSAPPTTLMQQQHRRRNSADVSNGDDDSAFSPVNHNGLPQSNTFTSLASLYSNGSSSAASSLLMHSPTSSSLSSPTAASLSPKSQRPAAVEQADPACVDAAASHIHSMLRRRGTWELRVARAQEEGAPHELARQATHVMMAKLPTEQHAQSAHHVLALISGHEVADRAAPADVADEGDPIEVSLEEDEELPRLRRQDSYLLALTESPALHVEPEIARIGDLFGRIDEWIGEVVLPTGVSALDYAVRQVATDAVLQQQQLQQRKKHAASSVINSPKLMPYVGEVVLSVPTVSF